MDSRKKKVIPKKTNTAAKYLSYPKGIRTCVILGAGASLSSCKNGVKDISELEYPNDFKFRFPLDRDFFPLAVSLADKDKQIKNLLSKDSPLGRLRDWLYPKNSDGKKIIGMEEFFTTVDQIHKWLHYKDRRKKRKLATWIGVSFLNLPFLPFSSKLDDIHYCDWSASPNKTTSLRYDTETLFRHQEDLAEYLKAGKEPANSNIGIKKPSLSLSSFRSLKSTFSKLQVDIRHLIAAVLMHIDKLTPDGNAKICPQLRSYLEKKHKEEIQNGGIAFISFNYDLLADRTVFHVMKGGEKRKWDPRHFYMQIFSDKLVGKKLKDYSPVLLKLHGSINWAYPLKAYPLKRDKLVCLDSRKNGPGNPSINDLLKTRRVPAIIPPFSEKLSVLQDSPLSGKIARLWTVAFDCLLRADRWVFIGYSLPLTDIPARWLFMSALAYKKKKGTVPKIDVYNPDVVKDNGNKLPLLKTLRTYLPPENKIKRFCCLQSGAENKPCEKHNDRSRRCSDN